MKKFAFALIAAVSMSFMACGGNTAENASVNDSDSTVVDSMVVDSVALDSIAVDSVVVAE